MKKILPFLAVAFSGFIVYLFDKIWGDSISWNNFSSVNLSNFLTFQFALYEILLFLLFAIILFIIGKKIFIKKDDTYTRKQKKLREYNKMKVDDIGVLMRWEVCFDNDKPFIHDLTPFCTKHDGYPIRFINNSCPMEDCENNKNIFNELQIKNIIESDLIGKWDEIK